MEKLVFKKMYLNFIAGSILIALAITGYFTGWFKDFLPYFFAGVLFLLTTKRFIFQFKKIISKNATLILVIEFALDLIAIGLLVYLRNGVSIFVGIVIYLRGFAYLLINYIASRKIKLPQYILNIFFVTLGSFFMFSNVFTDSVLVASLVIILIIFGVIYLLYAVVALRKKEEKARQLKENEKQQEKVEKLVEKKNDKIENLEAKIKKAQNEIKEEKKETKAIEIAPAKPKPKPINLELMTVVELKALATEKGLKGTSQLNKDELIKKLKEFK